MSKVSGRTFYEKRSYLPVQFVPGKTEAKSALPDRNAAGKKTKIAARSFRFDAARVRRARLRRILFLDVKKTASRIGRGAVFFE